MYSIRFGNAVVFLLTSASVVLCKETNNFSSTTPSVKTKEKDNFDHRFKRTNDKESSSGVPVIVPIFGGILFIVALFGIFGPLVCYCIRLCKAWDPNPQRNVAAGFTGNQMVYGANQPVMVAQPPDYNAQPPEFNAQPTEYNVQPPDYNAQPPEYNIEDGWGKHGIL